VESTVDHNYSRPINEVAAGLLGGHLTGRDYSIWGNHLRVSSQLRVISSTCHEAMQQGKQVDIGQEELL
jgi:hypothetical protein